MKQVSYGVAASLAAAFVSLSSTAPAFAQSGGPAPMTKPAQSVLVPSAPVSPSPAQPDPARTATSGAPATNVYTTLELKACKRITSDKDGGRWQCGGPKGYEVLFAEGDLRQFLGYGAKAREQRAAKQTLGPFNSIFKDNTDSATVQWRGTVQGGKFVPFATIVRYHTDTGDSGTGQRQRSQVLVVTKLGPADGAEACHVATIDALANKDANALATKTADELARDFDCRKDPAVTGLKGAVPPVLPTKT
jgi:hypothetical protein